jgi:hypothetical protein
MRRFRLTAALILIALGNGVALLGVARNRSGGPVQTIELTERELRLVPTSPDDTSVRLRLDWPRPRRDGGSPVFAEHRLKELGFACPPPDAAGETYRELPRDAFIAFELDPSAGQDRSPEETPEERVASAELPRRAAGAPAAPSRLVVVDASLDYDQLRRRYPDRQKHLVVCGVIAAHLVQERDTAAGKPVAKRWQGNLAFLIPREINVPLPYSRTLDPLKRRAEPQRYRVVLHYGRKLEPWVANVEVTD